PDLFELDGTVGHLYPGSFRGKTLSWPENRRAPVAPGRGAFEGAGRRASPAFGRYRKPCRAGILRASWHRALPRRTGAQNRRRRLLRLRGPRRGRPRKYRMGADMKAFFAEEQKRHDPKAFLSSGAPKPNPEQPERVERLLAGARTAGCEIVRPRQHGLGPIAA